MNLSLWSKIIMLLCLTALSGCGRKTMPVPPQSVLPEPVNDLSYTLDEKGITLNWSFPSKTVNGSDLNEIKAFEVLRAVVSEEDYCPDCPVNFGPPVPVSGGSVPRGRALKTAHYSETLLRPGHRYFYKVRCLGAWGLRSRDSNIISFTWDTPPQAPDRLEIKEGDRALTLTWQPPAALLDGRPVTGILTYRVYRSADGHEFVPLADSVTENGFIDVTVLNGERYYYKVQAVREYDHTRLAGVMSRVAGAAPRDLTPPAPPRHPGVVDTGAGIKVFWEAVAETDLAGYRLYRRAPKDKGPVLLGEIMAPAAMFVDRHPPVDAENWYYAVSSFDKSNPPNESPLSQEIQFTVVH